MWVWFASLALGKVVDSDGNWHNSIEDAIREGASSVLVEGETTHTESAVLVKSDLTITVEPNATLTLNAGNRPAIEVAVGKRLEIINLGSTTVNGGQAWSFFGHDLSFAPTLGCPILVGEQANVPERAVLVRVDAIFEATGVHFQCGTALELSSFGGAGGVIFGASRSTISLIDSTVVNGSAVSGGGIGSEGSVSLQGGAVDWNLAAGGGGVAMFGEATELSVLDTAFRGNGTYGYGVDYGVAEVLEPGAGGAISTHVSSGPGVSIVGASFVGNYADRGGAVALHGPASLEQVTFEYNSARYEGGDLYVASGATWGEGLLSCNADGVTGAAFASVVGSGSLNVNGAVVVSPRGQVATGPVSLDHLTLRAESELPAFSEKVLVMQSVLSVNGDLGKVAAIDSVMVGELDWLSDAQTEDYFCGQETRLKPRRDGTAIYDATDDLGAWGAGVRIGSRDPLVDSDGDGAPWSADCRPFDTQRSGWAFEVCSTDYDDNCDGDLGDGSDRWVRVDRDGDGVSAGALTCGAVETSAIPGEDCDDLDVDVGAAGLAYFDGDVDGHSVVFMSCEPGTAAPDATPGDCDDTNPVVHAAIVTYLDEDEDGSVVVGPALCVSDPGGEPPASGHFDCDDNDGLRYPEAVDEPGDGIDQNCSGADSEVWVAGCSTTGVASPWLALLGIAGLARRRGVTPTP